MPRFYCDAPLRSGLILELPAGAARHVQVLRLQPGHEVTLFNGSELAPGEWSATIEHMGRSNVRVQVGTFQARMCEPLRQVHLAVGMPANERMDWLVEKATELGVASITPLITERSVLRLSGERADKKQQHWHNVAIAACEQCGGNRVPVIHPVQSLTAWLKTQATGTEPAQANLQDAIGQRLLLSLREGTLPLRQVMAATAPLAATFLSGPEGGLSTAEEDAALAAGFAAVTLGPRVLRAETAALAALVSLVV